MNVRPDRLHQLLLAQDPAGVGGEQPEHLEGLRPQFDRRPIGPTQLQALLIQLETGKTKHRTTCSFLIAQSSGKVSKMF